MNFDDVQLGHAHVIVATVKARGLPIQAAVIALETAITESALQVLANPNDPRSLACPHDGVGSDHDSSGLFQQRPGWGPVEVRMDPRGSTNLFLGEMLRKVPAWSSLSAWVVAQDVQVSAFDGRSRTANNWTRGYGANYQANDAVAITLAKQLWAAPAPARAPVPAPAPAVAGTATEDDVFLLVRFVGPHVKQPAATYLTDFMHIRWLEHGNNLTDMQSQLEGRHLDDAVHVSNLDRDSFGVLIGADPEK